MNNTSLSFLTTLCRGNMCSHYPHTFVFFSFYVCAPGQTRVVGKCDFFCCLFATCHLDFISKSTVSSQSGGPWQEKKLKITWSFILIFRIDASRTVWNTHPLKVVSLVTYSSHLQIQIISITMTVCWFLSNFFLHFPHFSSFLNLFNKNISFFRSLNNIWQMRGYS